MSEVDPIAMRIFVEAGKAKAELQNYTRVVQQNFSQQTKALQSVEQQMRAGTGRIGTLFKGLAASVGVGSATAMVRGFLEIADASKGLEAQLKLATATFGTYSQAQVDAERIASATRSGIVETGQLYGSFIRASQELGRSQAEAATATETFSKALKVGGAGQAQVASATLQMGQALASANVQWEELGQILEASPRLGKLFTDSLGITRRELKKMAEDGKLSSEMLYRALTDRKYTEQIAAEFQELPATFDQAMALVSNAAIKTFGAFDRGGEFSTALATFISDGAEGFDKLADKSEVTGAKIRSTLEGLASAFEPLREAGASVFEYLAGESKGFGEQFRQEIRNTLKELDAIANFFIPPGSKKADMVGAFDRGYAEDDRRRANDRKDREMQSFLGGYDSRGNPKAGTPAAGRGVTTPPKPEEKTPKKKKGPSAEDIEGRFNDQLISLARQTLAARERLATTAEDRAGLELTSVEVARRGVLNDINDNKLFSEAQKERLRKQLDVLAAAEREVIERRRAEEVAQQQIDAMADDRSVLEAQAQLITIRRDRLAAELRILDATEEQERNELELAIASGKVLDAAKARANLAAKQAARRTGTERDNESPLERRRREVQDSGKDLGDAMDNIQIDALDRLSNGLADASTEFIKLGGIAGDVVNGIIRDLVRLAAQQAIFGSAGGGGILGSLGGLFGLGGKSNAAISAGAASRNADSLTQLASKFGVGIPGFASGTNSAPGGIALVGERGPELVNLPRGSQVIPNHQLAAAASMTGVSALPRASGNPVMQTLKFDLRGAVMTEDILAQMNSLAQQAAVQGAQGGRQLAMQDVRSMGRPRL